jgi:hypothetical protein
VINDFSEIYKRVGKVQSSYAPEIDELVGNGALVSRAQYPRLWEKAQTFGASLVSEATWNTASAVVAGRTVLRPYRGCFSTGDGSTTFRIPDLMNVTLRGIKSESGTDTERLLNKAGGFQRHEVVAHTHDIIVPPGKTSQTDSGNGRFVGGSDNFEPIPMNTITSESFGGAETRMDNVGILWTIKY